MISRRDVQAFESWLGVCAMVGFFRFLLFCIGSAHDQTRAGTNWAAKNLAAWEARLQAGGGR